VKKLNWWAFVVVVLYFVSSIAALFIRAARIGFDNLAVQIALTALGAVFVGLFLFLILYLGTTKSLMPTALSAISERRGPGQVYLLQKTSGLVKSLDLEEKTPGGGFWNIRPAVMMHCGVVEVSFWIGLRRPRQLVSVQWTEIEDVTVRVVDDMLSRRPALVLRTPNIFSGRRLRLLLLVMKPNGRLVPPSQGYFDAFVKEFSSRDVHIGMRE
jgi:hypothetical protein